MQRFVVNKMAVHYTTTMRFHEIDTTNLKFGIYCIFGASNSLNQGHANLRSELELLQNFLVISQKSTANVMKGAHSATLFFTIPRLFPDNN